jgi:predicted metal-dependent hydrolase
VIIGPPDIRASTQPSPAELPKLVPHHLNLHTVGQPGLGVYPPVGRVRVAAPRRLDEEQIRLAVIQRLPWIKRQREQLRAAERQSEREMVTGESHFVWGRRHRLKVIERSGQAHIEVDHDRVLLYMPTGTDVERRRLLLDRWYRTQLRAAVPALIAKW